MHKVLVNRLGGLSLPRKSVVRLTDRPDMTLDVCRGRKTTIQYIQVSCWNKCYALGFYHVKLCGISDITRILSSAAYSCYVKGVS